MINIRFQRLTARSGKLKILLETDKISRIQTSWTPRSFIRCFSLGDEASSRKTEKSTNVGKQFRTPGYQAETKLDDFPATVIKKFKKQRRPPYEANPVGYQGNKEDYKSLVYKWFLEAYPESISRSELAGRLRAHPKKVKTLILESLCEEGRIFKWGAKTAPFERYMPNVKAPEYYEATGEKGPVIPDIDEQKLLSRVQPRAEKAPKNEKSIRTPEKATSVNEKIEEVGWTELYEDTDDEEEEEEEESDDDDDDDDEDEDESQDWSSEFQNNAPEGEDLASLALPDLNHEEFHTTRDTEDLKSEDDNEDDDDDDDGFLLDKALRSTNPKS